MTCREWYAIVLHEGVCKCSCNLLEKTLRLEVIKRHDVEQWLELLPCAEGDGYAVDSPNLFDERIYPKSSIGTEKKEEAV